MTGRKVPAGRADSPIEIGRSALVVVDMQNDFCHDDGALAKAGIDVGPTQAMATRLVGLIETARSTGLPVIYLVNAHDSWSDSDVWKERHHGKIRDICRSGSWGAGLYAIAPAPGERVVVKHRYNAFVGSDFDLVLRALGVTTLIFTGVATNVCVESTARDAYVRDYRIALVRDCLAASSVDEHLASLRTLERYFNATVLDADQLERTLTGAGGKQRRAPSVR